ncbi:sugar phosphate isomerase/epimerase family protein [Blautia sp. MSJ-19]|uniref:sugar phosphate isomerase/epimerase family protein n=1 Tax=Blautia sp. MSJ-19 TaxID=2841517 RepID=UPI001C0F2A25|nr:sugar phosphate isomerase/epimerase [Blautia sp. MSJ-19]
MIYISHLLPDGQMQEIIKNRELGVESIEFSISENLDYMETTLETYKKRLEQMGNPSLILHGPFLDLIPATFDSLIREVTMKRFAQCYQAGRELGAKKIVYHSGMIPTVYFREGWAEQVSRFFRDFLRERTGLEIVMENVLDEDWRLLRDVCQQVDHPDFGLCLDIGHAHCYSDISVVEWAKELAPYVRHVHIHDNAGKRDAHMGLGKGNLPWQETLAYLPQTETRTWTVECMDVKDVQICVQSLLT